MVRLNLEATGRFIVKIENDPTNAVRAAIIFRPDLILLDVIMPKMEGSDVLCQLRDDPATQKIPVVFLTATVRGSEVTEEEGLIGGHYFIAKPCTVENLISVIDANVPSA